MAKVQLNPLITGVSGKLGNVIFRRTASGKISMSVAPDRSHVKPSASQSAHRERFKRAVAYAKAALTDPETRAYYEAAAAGSHKSPYNLALADYMKGDSSVAKSAPQSDMVRISCPNNTTSTSSPTSPKPSTPV